MPWLMRVFRRNKLERELDAELRFHVDEEAARREREGVAPEEARRQALARFGGIEPMKEQARDARGTRWLDDFLQDVRFALRMMRRSPVFTGTAILSLAVGIGANAAVFSVIDAVLLRTLPVEHPAELYFLNRAGYARDNYRFSYAGFERMRAGVPAATVAAFSSLQRIQVTTESGADLALGLLVSGNWFDLLGVRAQAGRVLTDDDAKLPDGQPVAVLSDRYWTRRFGRSSDVIGSTVRINGAQLQVVGIAAEGFAGISVGERPDVFMPVTLQSAVRYFGNASAENADLRKPWLPQDGILWLTLVARVPAAARPTATAQASAIHRADLDRQIAEVVNPEQRAYRQREHLELKPGARGLSSLRSSFSAPLAVLMATVGLVLLIACANLASMQLARSMARGREFALRLSLGAGRWRLVRQILTETTTLAGVGGVVGLVVARFGAQALLSMASSSATPVPLDIPMDWRLFGFAGLVSAVTGLLFGIGPAWRLSRASVHDAVKTGGRVVGAVPGRAPLARMLVVAQVALSLTLVVAAVLFLRTFKNLLTLDAGYERTHVVTARIDPQLAGFTAQTLPALYERLLTSARAIHGVQSASLAMSGPATGSARTSNIVIEGLPRLTGDSADVREEYVGPDYFATIGMPVTRGRAFTPGDVGDTHQVAVVNEAMAKHFFGDANPIGRHFDYDPPGTRLEIVGIVRDAHVDGSRAPVPPMVFYPLAQQIEFARNIYVRATGDTAPIIAALRGAVTSADRGLAVREVVTLDELSGRLLTNERLVSNLTGIFGLLALAVACLGLYGTMSYSVARRTSELGVRLALGASPGGLRWLVLRESLVLVAIGAALGLVIILPLATQLSDLVYGLSPRDPATLVGSAAALVMVGLLAGAIPAWRASRVNPSAALRAD